jgi:SAM-dependent methyltransferase
LPESLTSVRPVAKCPVCGESNFEVLAPQEQVERETEVREEFVLERVSADTTSGQMKDLTDFAHGPAARILICANCSLLLRDELDADYESDSYDRAAIEAVYPRYAEAFRNKEADYRHRLPPGAKVLEIGSHFGAFLDVAWKWGWDATGIDVGRDTSEFAKQKGFRVRRASLQECGFADSSFDGVFIWNCFEQIPEPESLLAEIRRVLKPGGLLLIRTPNAAFYRQPKSVMASAYNNLLGFPYLFGYSAKTLNILLERFGFEYAGTVNSELLTFPVPEVTPRVKREQEAISSLVPEFGPWIEVCYAKGDLLSSSE